MEFPRLDFAAFAAKYCERQEQTPEGLGDVLREQKARFAPVGWFMLECVQFDSSRLGSLVILPWGPNNTYKSPPEGAVSPRGLASDMSTVCAVLYAEDL
jgi:hypothetical protein